MIIIVSENMSNFCLSIQSEGQGEIRISNIGRDCEVYRKKLYKETEQGAFLV